MAAAVEAGSGPVSLRPLRDQVGGNFVIFEIDSQYVCKPLQARETHFYETLPEKLKRFTPEYKGRLNVKFSRNEDGKFAYVGYPMKRNGVPLTMTSLEKSESDNLSYLRVSKRNIESKGLVSHPDVDTDNNGANPWIDFRAKTMDSILEMSRDDSKQFDYIILENLTSKFRNPCIMDLKLGTRTYTDKMSEEKKQVHLQKCDTTTTKSLAIRLAGLQVYSAPDGKYRYMDKHDGCNLSTDALTRVMSDFFFDGTQHSFDLIPTLIEKLTNLRDVLQQLDSYRLFSSSLLIIYEGGVNGAAITNGMTTSSPVTTSDPSTTTKSSSAQDPSINSVSTSGPLNVTTTETHPNHSSCSDLLDIRMIDFANVTSNRFTTDPVRYDGPDDGFIQGLTNIIKIYEDVLKKN